MKFMAPFTFVMHSTFRLNMKLFFSIYKNRYAVVNLLMDAIMFFAVIYFQASITRVFLFYWFDTCILLLFFMITMKKIGELKWWADVALGSFIAILINCGFLFFLLEIGGFIYGNEYQNDPLQLLDPMFDVSIFFLASAMAQAGIFSRVKWISDRKIPVINFMSLNAIYSMLLMALAYMLAAPVSASFGNEIAMLLSFVIIRNRLDNWRVRNLNRLKLAAIKNEWKNQKS